MTHSLPFHTEAMTKGNEISPSARKRRGETGQNSFHGRREKVISVVPSRKWIMSDFLFEDLIVLGDTGTTRHSIAADMFLYPVFLATIQPALLDFFSNVHSDNVFRLARNVLLYAVWAFLVWKFLSLENVINLGLLVARLCASYLRCNLYAIGYFRIRKLIHTR